MAVLIALTYVFEEKNYIQKYLEDWSLSSCFYNQHHNTYFNKRPFFSQNNCNGHIHKPRKFGFDDGEIGCVMKYLKY